MLVFHLTLHLCSLGNILTINDDKADWHPKSFAVICQRRRHTDWTVVLFLYTKKNGQAGRNWRLPLPPQANIVPLRALC